jgi:hypothetical protein
MRYRVNFFTGVVPQLQFWHIHWLVFIQPVDKVRWQVPRTLQSCVTEELLHSSGWRLPRNISVNIHARCNIHSVCIPWSFGHNWDLPRTKCIECTEQRFSSSWQITLLRMCYSIWQWCVSWDLNVILYFGLVFLKQQVAYRGLMREFIFSKLIHSRTYIQAVFLIVTENMNTRRHNQIRTLCRLSRIDFSVMFSPFSMKHFR